MVLGNADREAAHEVAEAIRVAAAGEPVQTSAGVIHCTVSIGVSGWPSRTSGRVTTEMLLQEGDQALYASKANGRNRVTLATSLEDP